jgi:hypothetical protein
MVKIENSLRLGDCDDSEAIVKIIQLGEAAPYTYRLEFGNLVIDIPNETTAPNTEVGLYQWNGKNHQRVVLDSTSDGTVTIKMNHADLYLEAQNDRIFQVVKSSSENQKWTLMPLGEEPPISILNNKLVNTIQNTKPYYVDLKGRVVPSQKKINYQNLIDIYSH